MKKLQANQSGIGHLALLLTIVVVGAVVVVGLRVMHSSTVTSTSPATISHAKVPAKFASTADVQKAATALDATNVDSGVNPDQLNNDLNSLL